ncbi:MAG: hypothetical protein UHU19_03730, partial [Lachnospiraceae bacterium]|nr:hypothetical protein [Lachnospiraceae bacterium]
DSDSVISRFESWWASYIVGSATEVVLFCFIHRKIQGISHTTECTSCEECVRGYWSDSSWAGSEADCEYPLYFDRRRLCISLRVG